MFKLLKYSAFFLTLIGLSTGLPQTSQADTSLSDRITAASGNAFEQGTYEVLQALETALQTRYAYGLGQSQSPFPVLRIPLPGGANPAPKAAAPDTPSQIMSTLVADLNSALATLERAETQSAAPFDLPVGALWLDVNANGAQDKGEDVLTLLARNLLGRRAAGNLALSGIVENPPVIRFDEADLAWLTAYAHMLSGLSEAYLAYDPAPVWADLAESRAALANAPEIESYYDLDELRAQLAELRKSYDAAEANDKAFNLQRRDLLQDRSDARKRLKELQEASGEPDQAAIDKAQAELKAVEGELNAQFLLLRPIQREKSIINSEIRSIEQQLPESKRKSPSDMSAYASEIDMAYVVLTALAQEPDATHVKSAFAHWRKMIAHNRVLWTRLDAETDNEREWLPNPRQTSAFGVEIDADTARIWQTILAEGEALLDGRLLVPHPLLPEGYGISLKLFEESPAPLGLVSTVHGRGLYSLAAKGETISPVNWRSFTRLTGGNAGGFALWFN